MNVFSNEAVDLYGLSKAEIAKGSILLGGSAAIYKKREDVTDWSNIGSVIFRWGDPAAEDVFSILLEQRDTGSTIYLPFTASTIIGQRVWSLVVQKKNFDPNRAYRNEEDYQEIPFDPNRAEPILESYISSIPTKVEALGKVATRYVLFEMAVDL